MGCHFLLQGSSQPGDWTLVSHVISRRFTLWATREAQTLPKNCRWRKSHRIILWSHQYLKPDRDITKKKKKKTTGQYHWWPYAMIKWDLSQGYKDSSIYANQSVWFSHIWLFSHIRLFVIPSTVACQAPLSIWFSRQDYYSRLTFPNVIHCINKLKNENYDISVDSEKAFEKFQHLFMMKALQKMKIEGTYLHIMKVIYDNPLGTSFSAVKTVKNWKHFL